MRSFKINVPTAEGHGTTFLVRDSENGNFSNVVSVAAEREGNLGLVIFRCGCAPSSHKGCDQHKRESRKQHPETHLHVQPDHSADWEADRPSKKIVDRKS